MQLNLDELHQAPGLGALNGTISETLKAGTVVQQRGGDPIFHAELRLEPGLRPMMDEGSDRGFGRAQPHPHDAVVVHIVPGESRQGVDRPL